MDQRTKRIAILFAAGMAVILAGVLVLFLRFSGREGEDSVPEPVGPFIYYRAPYYAYEKTNYGLVDAKGNVVLPLEHDSLMAVHTNGSRVSMLPGKRYFMAGIYEEFDAEQGYYQVNMRYALVSPSGERLTEYRYLHLLSFSQAGGIRFVGITEENYDSRQLQYEVLDEQGRAVSEDAVVEAAMEQYRRDNGFLVGEKAGPDVPEDGFIKTLELGDSRYWGLREDHLAMLYDGDGRVAGQYVYRAYGIWPLTDSLWAVELYHADEEMTGGWMLIEPDGTPYHDETYDSIWSYSPGKYLVVQQGDDILVVSTRQRDYMWRLPVSVSDDAIIEWHESGDSGAVSVRSSYDEWSTWFRPDPIRIYFPDTYGMMELQDYAYAYIAQVACDGTRFVLYYTDDISDQGEAAYFYSLVDQQGNTLLSELESFRAENDYLILQQPHEEYADIFLAGLYDMDGQQVLPHEYSVIYEVLDGGAAHVRRGDNLGIVDLQGNWIYRESVFQFLD